MKEEKIKSNASHFSMLMEQLGLQDREEEMYALFGRIAVKGRLSAEDLYRAIGDKIPGAVNLGAESMCLSHDLFVKRLKAGEIRSAEFIPGFIQELYSKFLDPRGDEMNRADFDFLPGY